MFSDPPLLRDFVYPIPYCQSQTNLDSILNVFHRWNCQQIAIYQKDGTWGIIESTDLLSFISEVYLDRAIVAQGRFRSTRSQQTFLGLNNQSLSLIVKPAVVYELGTRLDEFLSLIPKGSLSGDCQKYLIVDKLGKLQGKLDRNKILEYLALEYKPNLVNNSPFLRGSSYCLDLINSIPLPLKIETTSGEDLYFNSRWQELIIGDRYTEQRQSKAIARQWIEQQFEAANRASPIKAENIEELENCLSDGLSVLSSSLLSGLTQSTSNIRQQEILTELDFKIEANSVNKKQRSNTRTPLEIQQTDNWNYVKIPFSDRDRKHQLVLALPVHSSTLSKSTVNRLLATVSHELKSPLTGIVGLSNLLEAQKLGQLNQRQIRYLELIRSSGQKMMSIVNDSIELITLSEKSFKESESVDFKLLCQQVYQQVLDRLKSLNNSDIEIDRSGEQSASEPGIFVLKRLKLDLPNNIAIANKSHLSYILFQLMMEVVEFAKSPERLEIKISSVSGAIAIAISGTATTSPSEQNYNINSSLRLAMVKYLTEFIQGSLKSDRCLNKCQFTLLLPIQSDRSSDRLTKSNTTTKNAAKHNLTILCLYPETEAISDRSEGNNSLNLDLQSWQNANENRANYRHRIIEADGLEQAHTLARIWQLDVIVLEGQQLSNRSEYLQLLHTSEYLSALPLITLDNETTQAANQIEGLNVYPCLLPAEHRRIEDLMQVIQIAAGV